MSSKQKKLRFGSIAKEASACRKAFEHVEVGTWVVHCHHEVLFEKLTEPAENRIAFILSSKPEPEQALRLRLFRPLPQTVGEELAPLDADYKAKGVSLFADYKAKCAPLDADYRAKLAPLYADYQDKLAPLVADYQAKCAPLVADYQAKCAPLDADYQDKLAPLYADYQDKLASIHAKNCIAGCPWDGITIFTKT